MKGVRSLPFHHLRRCLHLVLYHPPQPEGLTNSSLGRKRILDRCNFCCRNSSARFFILGCLHCRMVNRLGSFLLDDQPSLGRLAPSSWLPFCNYLAPKPNACSHGLLVTKPSVPAAVAIFAPSVTRLTIPEPSSLAP